MIIGFQKFGRLGGCHGPHARPVSLRLPHGAGSIQMQGQAPLRCACVWCITIEGIYESVATNGTPRFAAGALLVIMETIADFGTVSYFSVQTFATGIYTSWFGLYDRAAASNWRSVCSVCHLDRGLEHINRGRTRTRRRRSRYHFHGFNCRAPCCCRSNRLCFAGIARGDFPRHCPGCDGHEF